MRSTISKLLLIIFILFFNACSQNEKSTKSRYSDSTLKSFEEIERMEALERYKKLRERDWKNYNRNNKRKRIYKRVKPRSYSRKKSYQPKPTPKPIPELSKSQKEALERELNQNMAYFCMMNRKDSRFSNEADCNVFVENNYYECKTKHGIEISKSLVSCLKTKLR